jgi:MFS family permease
MLEYAWAIAGILGLSVIGLLITQFGRQLPLYLLAGGLILSSVAMGLLPRANVEHPSHKSLAASPDTNICGGNLFCRIRAFFDLGPHKISAWGAISVNFFNFFASFHLMITHGAYLELEYGLGAARLGAIALVLGLTDWAGSIIVSALGDRIGKRRSLIIAVSGMVLSFLLLPFLTRNFSVAIMGLVLPRFFFEFATVSNLPLLSEQYPASRAKVLSLGVAAGLLGTTVAATTGPAAYLKAGLWGLGPVSAVASLVSLILLILVVRER